MEKRLRTTANPWQRQVIRIALLCLVCVFTWIGTLSPAYAQSEEVETRGLGTEAILQLEELGTQAFAAMNAGDLEGAEKYWTLFLEQVPDNAAAWSNRGNVKVSLNKLEEAIADYNQAIALAPDAPDPYLNRGTAYEGLKRWDDAIADYNHVLELDPEDPAAYNNRGNAEAGRGNWTEAVANYQKASELAPDYAFARANYTLALYQTGEEAAAIKSMKNILRKYPKFADMRAALTAALWTQGNRGEAESNWVSAVGLDTRYKDLDWVAHTRRWPPAMVSALEKFLKIE